MTVTYINRKSRTYYLHQGQTSKGNPKYYFAQRQEDGKLVDIIPSGYEIYENPNGRVFLQQEHGSIITAEEVAAVEAGMQKYGRLARFTVDVKKDTILIYTPDQDIDLLLEAFGPLAGLIPRRGGGETGGDLNLLAHAPVRADRPSQATVSDAALQLL